MKLFPLPLLALLCSAALALADAPPPTIAGGTYADTPGCKFDFWQATGGKGQAPLAILIHGGGFIRGTRENMNGTVPYALSKGFAVMTLDYPYLPQEPVQKILHLCARAVQYARYNAAAWKIDPRQIVCVGGSAGAGTSLWIAVHPDLADPASSDPVARESSRVSAIGLTDTQSTYNMFRWHEIVGFNGNLADMKFFSPVQFYHFPTNDQPATPEARAMLKDVDMYGMIDAKTPPVFMSSKADPAPPVKDGDFVHHPLHDQAILKKAKEYNVTAEFVQLPFQKDVKNPNPYFELLDKLQKYLSRSAH